MSTAVEVDDDAYSLEPDAIRRGAEKIAGHRDWDDSDIVEPLKVLTDSLRTESGLSQAGQINAATRFRKMLAGYIGVQHDARRNPEILEEKVEAPLVITGLPRCGTTLTAGLMSSDPALRMPVFWEAVRPSPPPDVRQAATDPRRADLQAEMADAIKRSPNLLASLPYSADLKAECCMITQPAMRSVSFYAYFAAAAYQRWLLETDPAPMFKYHRRALQQFQFKGPEGRWLLKNPPHIQCIEGLMAEYPDARLIQNHRDPKKVLSSACALYYSNQQVNIDNPDKNKIGREILHLLSNGTDRMEAYRARNPDHGIIDVYFDDLNADPLAGIRKIYDALDMELTPEAFKQMQAWLEKNARDKRPVQRHSLEEFGLSAGEVDERFSVFRRNHGFA